MKIYQKCILDGLHIFEQNKDGFIIADTLHDDLHPLPSLRQ